MPVTLFGIALFNTLIGIENINKNSLQYAKQRVINAKIERILELLQEGNGHKMDVYNYIGKIDKEISALIRSEAETATTAGERDLYYLFENRKHALKWLEEKGGSYTGHTETESVAMPMTGGMPIRPY